MIVIKTYSDNISILNESADVTTNRSGKSKKWIRPDGSEVNMKLVDRAIDIATHNISIELSYIYRMLKTKDIFYTDDPDVKTMATDGKSIFINPAWVELVLAKLGMNDGLIAMEFVLIHECLHIVYNHTYDYARWADAYPDHKRANKAQDYEINYAIEKKLAPKSDPNRYKGITEKLDGCFDEKYGSTLWEQIYPDVPPTSIDEKVIKTSDKWKKGFKEGYEAYLRNLRKQGLVECYGLLG